MSHNLADRSPEEREKINVDLAASSMAYKERLNLPVISQEVERALPEAERRAYREKKRAEGYDVNSRTLAAFAGLYVFALAGAVLLINAVLRLLACAWVFTFEGHDLTRTSLGFALATLCFIAALLCHRGFYYCHRTLQRHVREE